MTENPDISAGQPLAPQAPSETTTRSAQEREGFRFVKQAWSKSIAIKVIACGVAFLILLFFILMVAFASSRSSLSNDLANEKTKSTNLEKKVKEQTQTIEDLTKSLDSEKRKSSTLQAQVDKLNKDIVDLNKKIEEQKTEINTLNTRITELQSSIESLRNQISNLNNEISKKDGEIANLKAEVTKRDTEITKLKGNIYYYQIGLIGSGIIHLIVTIDDISTRVAYGKAKTTIETLTNEVNDLKGKNHNLETTITKLQTEIEFQKNEVERVNGLRLKCQTELAHEKQSVEDYKREIDQLHSQLSKIPELALDQAILHMLLTETGYTYAYTPLYNATKDGYHKDTFLNHVTGQKPTVIVARTTSGYIFGGGISIAWAGAGGPQQDPKAFTFSSTHHKTCKVKKDRPAVNFVADNFLEFGNTEIKIDAGGALTTQGVGEADHDFECNSADHYTFYNNGQYMTINDLFAYQVTLTKVTPP